MKLKGIHLATDPIPRTARVLKTTTSGQMLAQLYGGGTANMEFESLTGQSLAQFQPQMSTPYQMLVTNYSSFPSAVGNLKTLGHEPIAIHPYMTSMYKREHVYPIFGFDRFIHDTTMQVADKLESNDFISDASAFHEVEYQIEKSSKPLLVNLVTMQNHIPMAGDYAHPINITGLSKENAKEGEAYSRGISYTDAALSAFLDNLRASDEKTVVVFYGDHLPGIWPNSVESRNGERTMHQTPYFIWNNFLPVEPSPQPTTSPIYFLPMAYEMVGAPLTPYYALLHEMGREIPAMEQGHYVNADNREVPVSKLSSHARQLLHDYRLVQYDFSVGGRYAVARMFPQAGPEPVSARP